MRRADVNRAVHTVRRLVFLYVLVFGAATMIVAGIGYDRVRHELAAELDQKIEHRSQELVSAFARGGLPLLIRSIAWYSGHGARTFSYVLIDQDGRRLSGVGNVVPTRAGWADFRLQDPDDGTLDPTRMYSRRLANGALLGVLADRDYVDEFDHAMVAFLLAASAAAVGMAVVGGLLLEHSVRSRLNGMNETARAIIAGDLEMRVPISHRNDEFDALSRTVNRMLERIAALLTEIRRINGYIAHDLRAPLTRLRADLAASEARCADANCLTDLGHAITACTGMTDTFDAFLQISEIDRALIDDTVTRFDASRLVAEIVDDCRPAAEARGDTLSETITPDVNVAGNRELLRQAMRNLIENAVEHTPLGARVEVGLTIEDGQAVFSVADDGPTPTLKDIEALLDEQRISGRGKVRRSLGLKLARTVARAHDGELTLEAGGRGLAASLRIPAIQPEGCCT